MHHSIDRTAGSRGQAASKRAGAPRVAATFVIVFALGAGVLSAGACSKRRGAEPTTTQPGAAPAGGDTDPTTRGQFGPMGTDCYDVKRAVPCPADPSDPSGKGLPARGTRCTLSQCQPCGSAKTPAFRNEEGVPTAGFCMCVPRSDDVGIGIFSCFTPKDWPASR